MMRDFEIKQIDWSNDPIGQHEFYKDYVSRSLPLVIKNGCQDWAMKEMVQREEGIKRLFSKTVGESIGNILMLNPKLSQQEIDEHFENNGVDS